MARTCPAIPLTPTQTTTQKDMSMKYNNPQIGCYFDGCHGQQYNDLRVLKLAIGYGWEDSDAARFIEADEIDGDDLDILSETVQEAEDYLNSLETRSYLSWQWNDGDFGLYPNVESAREDAGFVSVRSLGDARRMGIETDPEDSNYPPEDYRGEWLHVNDHGNCTLYVRGDDGKDVEVWSVV